MNDYHSTVQDIGQQKLRKLCDPVRYRSQSLCHSICPTAVQTSAIFRLTEENLAI